MLHEGILEKSEKSCIAMRVAPPRRRTCEIIAAMKLNGYYRHSDIFLKMKTFFKKSHIA